MTVQVVNDSGKTWSITSDGRPMIEAVSRIHDLGVALEYGQAYNIRRAALTPTAGGARVFCKIANTSADPLVVTDIRINDAAAGEVITILLCANYTATGTTAAQAVNRLFGSTNAFTTKGTAYYGVAISAPATSSIYGSFIATSGAEVRYSMKHAPVVLGPNQCLCLRSETSGSALKFEVDCHFAVYPRING